MISRFRHSHVLLRWIFLRILCFCFLAAFISIGVQITGLYGENGILPIASTIKVLGYRLADAAFINYPSIFFVDSHDSTLRSACYLGIIASAFGFCGILTGPMILLCWIIYLSIASLGQEFMGFQWDSLLLETSLLAMWFAPWKLKELHPWSRAFFLQAEVSFLFLWLLRFLCFKLMFLSGMCKLASHDPSWSNLSAMSYHYESQPLPTPLAWLSQKQPLLLAQLSTLGVLAIELVFPIALCTFSRPARIIASCSFIALMLAIMLTGNYAFFNLLTIALSLTLLDDSCLLDVTPRSFRPMLKRKAIDLKHMFWNSAASIIPGVLIAITSFSYAWMILDRETNSSSLPSALEIPIMLTQPLRSFNSYGLFAVMTTDRKEIIIEGSNDEKIWQVYEFKYKPGDLHRAPPIVAPHQPRLDWQMWFASLGAANQSPWFELFLRKILEGSPDVLGLLDSNPFPQRPPKFIRARIYLYQFSSIESLIKRGEWWQRKELGIYFPSSSLRELSPGDLSPSILF